MKAIIVPKFGPPEVMKNEVSPFYLRGKNDE
jgi:hypothetical protein